MTQAIKSIWRDNAVPLMMMLGFAIGMATGWADLKSDLRHVSDRLQTIEQRGSPQLEALLSKVTLTEATTIDNSQRLTNLNQRITNQEGRLIAIESLNMGVAEALKSSAIKINELSKELREHELSGSRK